MSGTHHSAWTFNAMHGDTPTHVGDMSTTFRLVLPAARGQNPR